jgi:hypothetical protein
MSPAKPTVTNVAKGSAGVGVQANVVHEVHQTYHLGAHATPKEKYEVGVRYLDNGVATQALELIDRSIAEGYCNSEVRFHQLLALLSGRTLQMLSQQDFARLEAVYEQAESGPGEWADGVRFIEGLLRNIAADDEDRSTQLLEDLEGLGVVQRKKIIRHLEMFLEGPLEDHAWRRAVHGARESQFAHDREKRAWKYFEPRPERPRMVRPDPARITVSAGLQVAASGLAFTVAAGYLGLLLFRRDRLLPLLAFAACLVCGVVWAWIGADWRFRNERLRAKDRQFHGVPRQRRPPPDDGFADRVGRICRDCFRRYAPVGANRQTWLDDTIGLRWTIRDEIAASYRDTKVEADAISWLIRHRVSAVKQQWQRGTLWAYRNRYRPSRALRIGAVACAFGVGMAGVYALVAAIPEQPLRASAAVPLALAGGWMGARVLGRIVADRRRYTDELAENREVFARSEAAYERWVAKLADTPSDSEMAAWLECDRVLLMNVALRHYKLRPSNMIVHTFIEAPADGCDAARERNGPWRFSRYRMLLFLLTNDGVRQMALELDFLAVSIGGRERTNYRFDAVASVRVMQGDEYDRTFELTLMSGYQLEVPVTGARDERTDKSENPGTVTDLTVDAAGLRNTLHILEGVAAEGKDWIDHEVLRGGDRIRRLRLALGAPSE